MDSVTARKRGTMVLNTWPEKAIGGPGVKIVPQPSSMGESIIAGIRVHERALCAGGWMVQSRSIRGARRGHEVRSR